MTNLAVFREGEAFSAGAKVGAGGVYATLEEKMDIVSEMCIEACNIHELERTFIEQPECLRAASADRSTSTASKSGVFPSSLGPYTLLLPIKREHCWFALTSNLYLTSQLRYLRTPPKLSRKLFH